MIVVDSSAIVDTPAGSADRLRVRLGDEELHAPMLLDVEVVSALRGLTIGGHLNPARAAYVLTDYTDLPMHRWETGDALRRRAFQLRANLSAYDATYVALAEALGCPLVTRDARLAWSTNHDATIEVH